MKYKTLIEKILSINSDDLILIIYDEGFKNEIDSFIKALIKYSKNISSYYLPIELQMAQLENTNEVDFAIPYILNNSIHSATVVINFLSAKLDTLRLRRKIINSQRDEICKYAHFPYYNSSILDLINTSDISKICSDSQLVAWELGEGEFAELKTHDRYGNSHILNLNLGGWKNNPIICDGIIRKGSWGNPVPGEVFICPIADKSSGKICINGSFYNMKLEPEEEIVLQFENGKLTSWQNDGKSEKVTDFLNNLKLQSETKKDENWNCLSEFGIGLNQSINKLTGNPIIDEKKYGTIHIALGDNSSFGHSTTSHIHYDLTVINPIVKINGNTIISQQEIIYENLGVKKGRSYAKDFDIFNYIIKSKSLKVLEGDFYKVASNGRRFNEIFLFRNIEIYNEIKHLIEDQSIPNKNLFNVFDILSKELSTKLFNDLLHYDIIIPE